MMLELIWKKVHHEKCADHLIILECSYYIMFLFSTLAGCLQNSTQERRTRPTVLNDSKISCSMILLPTWMLCRHCKAGDVANRLIWPLAMSMNPLASSTVPQTHCSH